MTDTTKKTILIIEDELPELSALRDKLVRKGFAILEAKNGEEGLGIALRDQPDLILLDIVMPVMDGMTMLKKLRAENEWGKTVPVIILTNLMVDDEQRNREIKETEPAYYLVKSDWKIEDVVAKVYEKLGDGK